MFATTYTPAKAKTSVLALLCAFALIASACGGGSSAESSVSTDGDTASDTQSQSAGSSDDGQSSESPLGELLGIPIGNDDETDQYFEDLSRQAEISIAECMIAQGFEYQVVDYSQVGGLTSDLDFESREFAEEYGFGIASDPFDSAFEAFESFEDPNEVYIETLTSGELDAYQTALNGELPDFDDPEALESFEPSGCQGEAFDEVFAFGRVFEQFGDAFEELEEAYDADPRVVTASAGWSACMTEAGYRYTDLDSAREDFEGRYRAITGELGAFAAPDAASSTDEEVVVFGPPSLTPEYQARVDELAVEERAAALAAWDCNGPVREVQDEVRLELEQRFVDENGAAIQAALDE